MKFISNILFSWLLLLFGCTQKPPLPYLAGSLSVKLNGRELTDQYPVKLREAYTIKDNPRDGCEEPIRIGFKFYDKKNLLRAGLVWQKTDLSLGKFQVKGRNVSCELGPEVGIDFYSIIGGDVSGDQYDVIPSPENFFELLSYDEAGKKVRGKFAITLVNRSKIDRLFPDTVRLTDGNFETEVGKTTQRF